jgi:Na+/H+ antiporter NhaD/arsenite permease-like protein
MWAALTNQINNGPMLFALLEMIQGQSHGFMPNASFWAWVFCIPSSPGFSS